MRFPFNFQLVLLYRHNRWLFHLITNYKGFFSCAIIPMQPFIVAPGADHAVLGMVNLLEGCSSDDPHYKP